MFNDHIYVLWFTNVFQWVHYSFHQSLKLFAVYIDLGYYFCSVIHDIHLKIHRNADCSIGWNHPYLTIHYFI